MLAKGKMDYIVTNLFSIFRVVELTRLSREIIYGSERLQVIQTMLLNHSYRSSLYCCHNQMCKNMQQEKLDILVNNHFWSKQVFISNSVTLSGLVFCEAVLCVVMRTRPSLLQSCIALLTPVQPNCFCSRCNEVCYTYFSILTGCTL